MCYPPIILRILLQRISAHNRARTLLGAHLYPPTEALTLGLVDELAEDCEALATKRLGELSAHPRRAYTHTKALLRRGVTKLGPEDERRFVQDELPQWTSDEVKARVKAILQR